MPLSRRPITLFLHHPGKGFHHHHYHYHQYHHLIIRAPPSSQFAKKLSSAQAPRARRPSPTVHAATMASAPAGSAASAAAAAAAAPAATVAPPPDRRPIVISGPSGVGKGTLYKGLFERCPDVFALSVSHTTRGPRKGEAEGQDYHFVTAEAFEALKREGGFLEWAKYGSNFYGTSKAAIREQEARGKVVVLDIEMNGVQSIKASGVDARYVFIDPPSMDVLEQRLRNRNTDTEESIQKRLAQAVVERENAMKEGAHDKIIVNDNFDTALDELYNWVYAPVESS